MAYLEHLAQLRTRNRRRLQKLEEQRAQAGYSTEPAILLEIEDIKKELVTLDTKISSHAELLDLFKQYENAFDQLLHQLGRHARGNEVLEYQDRMRTHMTRVREIGDTPSDSAEREQMLEQIDALAKQLLDKSFTRLMLLRPCGNPGRSPTLPSFSSPPTQPPGAGTSSTASIQNQNNITGNHNVTGDHNITNNASYQNIYRGPVGRPPNHSALGQRIATIECAVKSSTVPPLRRQALQQIGGFHHTISATDLAYMAAALAWFDQHLPDLSRHVRALICHSSMVGAIRIAGAEVYAEYQRRFGTLDGCEEI